MNPDFEKVRKNIEDFWARMKGHFNEVYGIEENKKPRNMQKFIEQKKNRKPFYKDDKKKSWE